MAAKLIPQLRRLLGINDTSDKRARTRQYAQDETKRRLASMITNSNGHGVPLRPSDGTMMTLPPLDSDARKICDKHIDVCLRTGKIKAAWYPGLTTENHQNLQHFFEKHANVIHRSAAGELQHAYLPSAIRVLETHPNLVDAGHKSMVYLNPTQPMSAVPGSSAIVYEYARDFARNVWPPFHAFSMLTHGEQSQFVSPEALHRTLYRWVETLPGDGVCGAMSAHTHTEWEWGDTGEYKRVAIQLMDSITLPVLKYEERDSAWRITGEEVIFPGVLRRTKTENGTTYYTHTSAGVYVGVANDCGHASQSFGQFTFLIVATGRDATAQIKRAMVVKHTASCTPPMVILPPSLRMRLSPRAKRQRVNDDVRSLKERLDALNTRTTSL